MKLDEIQAVFDLALPIFRKYAPNADINFSSGPAPLSIQDFLLSCISDEDRAALKAAGWKTNGTVAWFYERRPEQLADNLAVPAPPAARSKPLNLLEKTQSQDSPVRP